MHYSDEEILRGIRMRSKPILEYVYDDCYPLIKNMITKNSGNVEDVQDIFQDAMEILFRKVKKGKLDLRCKFKTYLYSVCQNLWLQKLEKRKKDKIIFKNVAQTTELTEEDLIEIYDEEKEKNRIYQKHYLGLARDCQDILRLAARKAPIGEIAAKMGYKTEKYAKVKKFRCKEELKRRIMNDSDYKLLS